MRFHRSDKRAKVPPTRKLVVVGDGSCGKTSLLYAFTHGEFIDTYTPTVFETAIVDVKLKESGKPLQLSLWDTAGQEDYSELRPLCYPGTHLVLICFAMDNRDTFDNVRDVWVPEIAQHCPEAALILVGCKCDLESPIEESEVRKVADEMKASACFVCSAKQMRGIRELFDAAAEVASRVGRRSRRSRLPGLECLGLGERNRAS